MLPLASLVRGHKNPFLQKMFLRGWDVLFQQATLDSKPCLCNTEHFCEELSDSRTCGLFMDGG